MRALALLLAMLPGPVLALSCLPHGVSDAYLDAANAEEGYVPVLGMLSFDPAMLPQVDWERQGEVPPTTLLPARFEGEALTVRGVDLPFAADVVLEVQCFGPWCPAPREGRVLAFLRKTSHSYVLQTNACGGYLFGNPSVGQITEVRDCLAGRDCVPFAEQINPTR
mmetsp:Transcript_7578/g.13069  ORF Transcript_7578/g.13069 Transcript_7578/m.13069 type:complete len:166 (-) Transcript_7578:2281-2778(-)